jgi:hypothetical protein
MTRSVMFGGAKGPGKSFLLCHWVHYWCNYLSTLFNLKPSDIPIPLGFIGRKQSIDFKKTTLETWKSGEEMRHEIFLSAESLSRGAKETLGTLLHEMAHAFNHAEKIEDVTGDGYHNKKFQSTAERIFGLKIEKAKGIGFSKTSVPDEALIRWSEELTKIEEALKVHALSLNGRAGKGRDKNGVKAVCGCGEIIRLSQKAYDNCRPMCSECEGYFVAE